MCRLWNENNVKSSKVVSLKQNKSHSPSKLRKIENNNVQYKWIKDPFKQRLA